MEALETSFPQKEIETNGQLVAYNEVLPFGDQLFVKKENYVAIYADSYCIRSGCDCNDGLIEILKVGPNEGPRREKSEIGPILRFNYKTLKWQIEDKNGRTEEEIEQLMDLFLKEKLVDKMGARHRKISALYEIFKKRELHTQWSSPVEFNKTPSKNEPCPCGSGKKYKRCCMS